MDVALVRSRLAAHRPFRVAGNPGARAAVAMLLRPRDDDADVLLIRRATRQGDPWSGQMAFPGGRRAPEDSDVIHTARRETREEVGIDLDASGELIGALDELHAVARHRPLDLVISPTVWFLRGAVEPVPHAEEVAGTVWLPLSFLRSSAARGVYRRTLDGVEQQFPAYRYEGYTVWGLTHRILEGFLRLVE
jgi:8-oxo-dGTP pyrophosphatase MutT (NUDIX family)